MLFRSDSRPFSIMTHFSSPQRTSPILIGTNCLPTPQLMAGSICSLGGGMIVSLVQPVGDEDYEGDSMVNLASMENQLEVRSDLS